MREPREIKGPIPRSVIRALSVIDRWVGGEVVGIVVSDDSGTCVVPMARGVLEYLGKANWHQMVMFEKEYSDESAVGDNRF